MLRFDGILHCSGNSILNILSALEATLCSNINDPSEKISFQHLQVHLFFYIKKGSKIQPLTISDCLNESGCCCRNEEISRDSRAANDMANAQ